MELRADLRRSEVAQVPFSVRLAVVAPNDPLSSTCSTHIVAISRERKKSGLVVQDLREQLEVLFKHVTTVLASINK